MLIGKFYTINQYEIKDFATRNFLNDLINLAGAGIVSSSENEYNQQMQYCVNNLKLL
jgi:hypothetical protein